MTAPFQRCRQDYLTDEDYRALQSLLLVNLVRSLFSESEDLDTKRTVPLRSSREGAQRPSPDPIQGLGGSRSAAVSSVNSVGPGAGKVTFPVATHSAPRAKVT